MARAKSRRAHGYSVYERKDGRWGWGVTIDYDQVSGNPKRIQGVERTQAAATEKAIAAAAKVKAGANVPQGRDRTVGDFLAEWLELYIKPHREPKTVAYYSGMINTHIVPSIGRTPLRKLTAAAVQRMLNEKSKPFAATLADGLIVEKQLSTETVRGIRATLRSALSRAFRDGLVTENVASRVETPQGPRKTAQHLNQEQAATLLQAAKGHHLQGLITLALLTGVRIGEATGLRWEDVDFGKQTLQIRNQLQRIDGKLVLKRLKSDRSHRALYLTDSAIQTLQEEKAKQLMMSSDRIDSEPFNPLGLVFLNPEGRPLDQKYVDTHLKALMTSVGLPAMSFHKLRHTVASLSLAAGSSLVSVSHQLGHSQIAVTANTYGHAVPTALQSVAENLERSLTQRSDRE